jgi:hypothetical protein
MEASRSISTDESRKSTVLHISVCDLKEWLPGWKLVNASQLAGSVAPFFKLYF